MAQRGNRSAEFERRSALYAHFDVQLCARTRFFAAAALINAVFARLFDVWPAIHRPRSFSFLNDVGAALEIDNLSYAREISRGMSGPLDRILVCAEQRRLQRFVRAQQIRCPQQWESIRSELNVLLNHRYGASYFSRWYEAGGTLAGALREIRGTARVELDFANLSHRILIGLKLIEHVRVSASAYGACGSYPTDAAPPP